MRAVPSWSWKKKHGVIQSRLSRGLVSKQSTRLVQEKKSMFGAFASRPQEVRTFGVFHLAIMLAQYMQCIRDAGCCSFLMEDPTSVLLAIGVKTKMSKRAFCWPARRSGLSHFYSFPKGHMILHRAREANSISANLLP